MELLAPSNLRFPLSACLLIMLLVVVRPPSPVGSSLSCGFGRKYTGTVILHSPIKSQSSPQALESNTDSCQKPTGFPNEFMTSNRNGTIRIEQLQDGEKIERNV
jgi:hypothetical protein